MRSDMKRFFSLGKPRKNGSALRASPHYSIILRLTRYYYGEKLSDYLSLYQRSPTPQIENHPLWDQKSSLFLQKTSVSVFIVVVVVVVDVVILTLTRIIKSVITGQAPVTLELRNTPGKNTNKPKVVHSYITADAIDVSTRNI